jgi:hypothetical protein
MALSVTTDLTVISTAETFTGWTGFSSSGPNGAALEPDFFIQGSNCISQSAATASAVKGMTFDIGAGNVLNFSTTHAGKLIYIWMRTAVPAVCDTRPNGGIRIILGSGTTAPTNSAGVWSAWYVDGSDTLAGTDGWKCYVIDPRTTPSTTFGGGVDLTAVRWFGGAQKNGTGTAKGQAFGIDQISYGFGTIRVSGTNTLAGRGFGEIADADFGTVANKYGIIPVVKEGVIYVQGRIQLGDSAGTAALTFTSQDETVVWTYPTYYDGTRQAPCVPDARPDGSSYFGIAVVGNATGATSVTLGAKVGSGDTAVGRSGTSFTGSRTRTSFTFDDGAVETVLIYGSSFTEIRGGLDFSSNASSDEFIGNNVLRSGSTRTGPVVMRANNFIDCYGAAYTGAFEDFRNDGATAALSTADPSYIWDDTLNGSNWSVPAGVPYVELLDPGASDRREVTKITADVVGNNDHYAEAIIRFPSAGANQGSLGVCIRMATSTTENYYYLKCDIRNSQVTLIRCDGGTDTAIDGPDAFTFSEDTDYLVHLIANGDDIEGFVSGGGATVEMFAASQASYNTNRRVGIRGDAEADQTGDAPRLSRFGCGPETDDMGALFYATAANANVKNCRLINSARAICIENTGTYTFTGFLVSGNAVGTRNQSGGAVTVNASSGDSPSVVENKGSATTTINNTVSYTLTNLVSGSEIRIFKESDGSELAGVESSSTSFNYDYTYVADTNIYVIIQKTNYEWLRINDTLTSSSKSQKVLQRVDLNYVNA